MKIKAFMSIAILLIIFCMAMNTPFKKAGSGVTLKKVASIDLPGEPGKRFDYLTIDYKHNYLLSAHMGADLLYVIDTKKNVLVALITHTYGIEGLEYVEELNKVYASDWGDHTVGVVDMNKLVLVKKIPVMRKPDGSVYASDFKKLYVSDERARTLIVIDVNKDTISKKISFKSKTGMPQYDSVAKKIYLNLQDNNMFVVIDPATDAVIGEYKVGDCKGNHGMALDVEHRRAFLSCEDNDLLTVFDIENHKVVASLKMASGADVVKYDPGLKRIYVACSSGFISVFHEDDASHFTKLEDFPVEKRVHSLAVDQYSHRVYAPEQEEEGRSVSRMIVYDAVIN